MQDEPKGAAPAQPDSPHHDPQDGRPGDAPVRVPLGVGPVAATNPARGRPAPRPAPLSEPSANASADASAEGSADASSVDLPTAKIPGREHGPQRTLASDLVPTPSGRIEKGQKLGRYLMLDKLGEGGMGVVYAAYDPELDRKVALKILSARFNAARPAQARLLREAQAMARVAHPNVIAVYDVGTVNDQIFVAMELVDGGTLNRWFKDSPRTWREILNAFVDAGRGLAAAHAAGLVHRDFKPDNVLVSKDGRVRVTDFGLARLVDGTSDEPSTGPGEPELPRTTEDSARLLETPLTQVGAVMGTPAYMSPEQHLGQVPDARSDQFSFCAALYWALFRKRAFDPKVLAAVAGRALSNSDDGTKIERPNLNRDRAAVPGKGIVREPPKEPRVPKYVRRALMRGLAIDPDQRFGDMQALLKALSRDPRVVQRRYMAAATTAVVLGVAVFASQQITRQQQLCSGAERKLAGVWDADVRAAIGSAFAAVGKPWAQDATSRIGQHLDSHVATWTGMHREACEATRIRGEQSEQVMALRMLCLDRRLGELRALTDLLRRGDPGVLERGLDTAYSLTPVSGCADVAALTAPVPRPEAPEKRVEVEAVEALLAEVKAQYDAGKYRQALAKAEIATARSEAIDFPPLEAEALDWLGWLQTLTGEPKLGEVTLKKAVLEAEAGRHDDSRLQSASRLVFTVGFIQSRFDEARDWYLRADALLRRVGRHQELEAEVLAYHGAVLGAQGRVREAAEVYERAIALADEALPPGHPRRASFRSNLANIYGKLGDGARAIRMGEEALDFIVRTRGENHPRVAYAHYTLAIQRRDAGDLALAHQHIDRALAIRRAVLAPSDPLLADTLDILCTILNEEGRHEEALEHARQSLEIKRTSLGMENATLAYAYENMGQAMLGLGRAAEAIELLETAIRLRERNGVGEAELAEPRFALARAVLKQTRDRKRATQLAVQARDAYTKMGDQNRATRVAQWLQQLP